jgi:uridine kinase
MNTPQKERHALSSSLPNYKIGDWEESMKQRKKRPFIIGVCGGTASGKTSVCEDILKKLENQRVVIISQDSFYCALGEKQLSEVHSYNFDHPNAFDWKLLEDVLGGIKAGKRVDIPQYSFITHSRLTESTPLYGADVILFEGILAFYTQQLRETMDLKLFVDTDADTRLSRRVMRDISERGRTLQGVLHQYETFVKPAFEEYILPTKKYADVIIPRGIDNQVAIKLIVQHIRTKLDERDPTKIITGKASYFEDDDDDEELMFTHES